MTGLGLGRRGFLALSAAGAIAAASQPADAAIGVRFAVVTDTHSNVDDPARHALLSRIFAAIDAAEPDFVLNCGDITEYGSRGEIDAYLNTIPDELRPRVRHVPGNHEVRWDVNGAELYREKFGPAPFSFDLGGLHVVGLDPTTLLQEPGLFGPEDLAWLDRDLRRAGQRPSVLFLHYPLGAHYYYVNDQDAFLETIAPYPVRAIFAGHIHTEQVQRFNGLTQVAADATKDGPWYYAVERLSTALKVELVTINADGTTTRRSVATIPLGRDDTDLKPIDVDLDHTASASAIAVDVRLARRAQAQTVQAQVYPQHVFGGSNNGTWVDLTASNSTWSGEVDVSALPPGAHRLQVRVSDAAGTRHELTEPFTLPGGPAVRWTTKLAGKVQGALAAHGDLVVAASTAGTVKAFRPTETRARLEWDTKVGPVYRGAAFSADGRTVFVPSADRHLYALGARDGKRAWRFRTPDPVLSMPLATTVDGRELVIFTAGTTLYALDARTGARVWDADLHGFFAGRVACDGERVYTGGGDGNAYAFDARTGAELWTASMTTRTTAYVRLIYGPWDDVLELLPNGTVLVSTVTSATALDRATGAVRWTVPSGALYPPSILLDDQRLLIVDEFSRFQLISPATGVATWRSEVGVRTLNAGPVIAGDRAWIVATTGLLASLDLATGAVGNRLQLTPANTFSTPVVVDGLLVAADQAGVVRGIALPA